MAQTENRFDGKQYITDKTTGETMSEEEPNYNSVWDLHGNPINTPEPDKEPVCECDICGQDHAEIQHCAFKGLIDDLKNELAEARQEIQRLRTLNLPDGGKEPQS